MRSISGRLTEGLVVAEQCRDRPGPHDDVGGDGPGVGRDRAHRAGPRSRSDVLVDMHFGERGRRPRLLSAVALDPDDLGIWLDENTVVLRPVTASR